MKILEAIEFFIFLSYMSHVKWTDEDVGTLPRCFLRSCRGDFGNEELWISPQVVNVSKVGCNSFPQPGKMSLQKAVIASDVPSVLWLPSLAQRLAPPSP